MTEALIFGFEFLCMLCAIVLAYTVYIALVFRAATLKRAIVEISHVIFLVVGKVLRFIGILILALCFIIAFYLVYSWAGSLDVSPTMCILIFIFWFAIVPLLQRVNDLERRQCR
jgi:hypothetical protein